MQSLVALVWALSVLTKSGAPGRNRAGAADSDNEEPSKFDGFFCCCLTFQPLNSSRR